MELKAMSVCIDKWSKMSVSNAKDPFKHKTTMEMIEFTACQLSCCDGVESISKQFVTTDEMNKEDSTREGSVFENEKLMACCKMLNSKIKNTLEDNTKATINTTRCCIAVHGIFIAQFCKQIDGKKTYLLDGKTPKGDLTKEKKAVDDHLCFS